MSATTRLDTRMHALGLCPSREKARAMIMAGAVLLNGKPAAKPGTPVSEKDTIELCADPLKYVSRGGLKLEKAIDVFALSLDEKIAVDIGASTGGFTDCMLQNGAAHVYAVDVGYGQLDWKLRNDARVSVMERKNARYMAPDWFSTPLDFASIDVSFISVRLILPPLHACLRQGGQVAMLIKPQFEAGRAQVQKHGVVRDESVHCAVIEEVLQAALSIGYDVCGLTFSPVTGPKGNIEFLAHLQKSDQRPGAMQSDAALDIAQTVRDAHSALLHAVT